MSDCRVPMTTYEKPGHELAWRNEIAPCDQIERRGPSVEDIPHFRWNGYELVPKSCDFALMCDEPSCLTVEFWLMPKFEEVDHA